MNTEVIRGHTVDLSRSEDKCRVLDLGAHTGSFSELILKKTNWTVESYEPKAELSKFHDKLKSGFGGRYFFHNKAVGAKTEEVEFSDYGGGNQGNSIVRRPSSYKRRGKSPIVTKIDCVSINDILDKYNNPRSLELLKLDVEGAELEMLNSISDNNFLKINQITVEFHCLWADTFTPPMSKEVVKKTIDFVSSKGFNYLDANRGYRDILFYKR
jgi:FkbM family methyltransferase